MKRLACVYSLTAVTLALNVVIVLKVNCAWVNRLPKYAVEVRITLLYTILLCKLVTSTRITTIVVQINLKVDHINITYFAKNKFFPSVEIL